jgi:hypothetical protein
MAIKINEAVLELKDELTVVIYHLYDNTAFRSGTENGDLLMCKPDRQGRYHVPGDVQTLPRELMSALVEVSMQALTAGYPDLRLILTPLPRYLFRACCGNDLHCVNGNDEDFGTQQLNSLKGLWKEVRDTVCDSACKGAITINPVWAIAGEDVLDTEEQEKILAECWSGPDPVHMDSNGYFKLAAGLMRVVRKQQTGKKEQTQVAKKRARDDEVPPYAVLKTPFHGTRGGRVGRGGQHQGPYRARGSHRGGNAGWGPTRRGRGGRRFGRRF